MRGAVLDLAFLLFLGVPAAALGASHTLEVTPLVGFRSVTGITVEDRAFHQQDFNVNINSDGAFGLMLASRLRGGLMAELLLSRQRSGFEDKRGLFGEEPGGFVAAGDRELLDVELVTFQGGLTWEMGKGWSRPFLGASYGITKIRPSLPLPADDRPSFSLVTGIKGDLNHRLGLRAEARYHRVDTDESLAAVSTFENRDCTGPCSYIYRYRPTLSLLEIGFGLTVKI